MSDWRPGEIDTLVQAAGAVPIGPYARRWVIEVRDRDVLLVELEAPAHHDASDRDQLLALGGVEQSLLLAVRCLGWDTEVDWYPDRERPDHIATVRAIGRLPPTRIELDRHAALSRQCVHRASFSAAALSGREKHMLVDAARGERVAAHLLSGASDAEVLATMLDHAAHVFGRDRGYRREVAAWTAPCRHRGLTPRDFPQLIGVPHSWPPHRVLTARIARESVFVVQTVDDGQRDRLRAGAALQRTWLEATRLGLAASTLSRPMHLVEARSGLMAGLGLPGFPQAILRVGHPVRSAAPGRPRRTHVLAQGKA